MSYAHWPYLSVFLLLVAGGLGFPLPEDVPLLTGGFLCHQGLAHLYVMIAVAMVGVLGADVALFSLGRRFGHHIVEHRWMRRLVNPSRLAVAENLFGRHGVKIIFAGRFLPGLRPMIFMAAGVLRVSPWTFLAVDGFAAVISVPTLIVLGYLFGGHLEELKRGVRDVTHMLGLGAAVVAIVALGIYLHRRQKRLMNNGGSHQTNDSQRPISEPGGQPRAGERPDE